MSYIHPGTVSGQVLRWSPPAWWPGTYSLGSVTNHVMVDTSFNVGGIGWDGRAMAMRFATGQVFVVQEVSTYGNYSQTGNPSFFMTGPFPPMIRPTTQQNVNIALSNGQNMLVYYLANGSIQFFRPLGSGTPSGVGYFSWNT